MTEDRGDWVVDTEGNLTPPGGDGLKPPTDEFGRDDPASIERERRRREREQRRGKSKKPRKVAKAPKQTRARKAAAPPAEPAAAAPPVQKPPRRSVRERLSRDGGDPRPPKTRGGPYTRRRFLALGLVLVGVLVAWFLIAFFQPPPFDPGNGSGEAIVTVPEGATASEVSDLLTRTTWSRTARCSNGD